MITYRRSYTTDFGVVMRRITWAQFWRLRPDRRPLPENDNRQAEREAEAA